MVIDANDEGTLDLGILDFSDTLENVVAILNELEIKYTTVLSDKDLQLKLEPHPFSLVALERTFTANKSFTLKNKFTARNVSPQFVLHSGSCTVNVKKDLISLLRKSMDNFKLIAKEKNMDYRLVTPVQSVYGWVDKDKFEKIFFNLLSNAFKYTSPGKAITIKVIPKEESVDIEVKDEGIGIVPDKQRVLFQRFESLVKQNILQPSSGIGLSLAKENGEVEKHH
jgi:signal transduction histidine kinase